MAERALRTAVEVKDDAQVGLALENLAGQANAMGALADALEYRARGLDIHRRQNDLATVPFDLTNRADLLIRVGRHSEAAQLLDEVDAGIANKLDAYVPRARRVRVLRALSAAIQLRHQDTARSARDLLPVTDGKPDSNSQLAALLVTYGDSQRGTTRGSAEAGGALSGSVTSANGRELRYWDIAGRLAHNDARRALSAVEETLASNGATVSYEFEWRIAAIGAAAARRLKDVERERVFNERAQRALARLRKEWKSDVASYEARPDLAELRRKAGLN